MEIIQNSDRAGNGFNTLAQLRTPPTLPLKGKNYVVVNGKGSELGKEKTMKGRAKRKMITQKRTLKLIDVAKRKGDDAFSKQLWNTFHCQNNLITTNGRMHGNYCKNRFCALCCSIRKAILINKYAPILNSWEDPYFVGLTVKSVPAHKLKKRIDAMYRAFDIINSKIQKRRQRGQKIDWKGIKTLECEFNDVKRTYNPHFNFMVPNKEVAELLRAEWCKLWTRRFVNPDIQYCEPVRSRKKVMKEVIKYCTKTFTEPDKSKKLQRSTNPKIYVAALYNIMKAMQGHRIVERFGFNLPKPKEVPPKGGTVTLATDYIRWMYDMRFFDWVGEDTAGTLATYTPEPRLLYLLDNCMDVLLE